MSANLWESNSQLRRRQDATFRNLSAETFDVETLTLNDLVVYDSILPATGGVAIIGNSSKPFLNVQSTSFTGTNGTFTNLNCSSLTGASGFLQSIRLLTSGGTGTALNFYEEYKNDQGQASGIWASTQDCKYLITRIGRQCTLTIPQTTTTANAASVITITTPPTRFIPSIGPVTEGVSVIDNGTESIGRLSIATNGTVLVSKGDGGNFGGAGNSGFYAASISYQV